MLQNRPSISVDGVPPTPWAGHDLRRPPNAAQTIRLAAAVLLQSPFLTRRDSRRIRTTFARPERGERRGTVLPAIHCNRSFVLVHPCPCPQTLFPSRELAEAITKTGIYRSMKNQIGPTVPLTHHLFGSGRGAVPPKRSDSQYQRGWVLQPKKMVNAKQPGVVTSCLKISPDHELALRRYS